LTLIDDDTRVLSIDSPEVPEATSGSSTTLQFTVSLSAGSTRTVTVDYADAGTGSATSGTDYAKLTAGTLTFAPGETSKTIDVTVNGDNTHENNETVVLRLSNAVNANLVGNAETINGIGTITDMGIRTVSVTGTGAVIEGDDPDKTADMKFVVNLSVSSTEEITVPFSLGGSATLDEDYTAPASRSVTFPPGSTSQEIIVKVIGDTFDEANERISVTLSDATNAKVATGSGTALGTITDDDATPTVTLKLTPPEIDENGGSSTVTATLSGVSSEDLTLTVSATPDTPAVAGDFQLGANQILTIPAGETESTGTVTVTAVDNSVVAKDKSITIAADASGGVEMDDPEDVKLTIWDDDNQPRLLIDSPMVEEGASGENPTLTFTVTLSKSSSQGVTVNYAAVNTGTTAGTATSGEDHAALTSGKLTFGAMETEKTIAVTVTGDDIDEPNETVVVQLSKPTNAKFAGNKPRLEGIGTITDDDATPTATLILTPSAIKESGASDTTAVTATLSGKSSEAVTLKVSAAADPPAVAGDFRLSSNRMLTIAPGKTESDGKVTIMAVDNIVDGPDKTVTVTATASGGLGLAAPPDATLTIQDNDLPEMSIDEPSVIEGANGKNTELIFTATLSTSHSETVTVKYRDFRTGTATSGTDYAPLRSGTLTFAPGDTSKTIAVTVADDDIDEPNETVAVELTDAINATFPNNAIRLNARGTIIDDEATPTVKLKLTPSAIEEGDATTVTASTDIASSEELLLTVWADPVAPAVARDLSGLSNGRILTISAGETESTGTVMITAVDNNVQADDKFATVRATARGGLGVVNPENVKLLIWDDEGQPRLLIDSPSVAEGAKNGTATLTFTVTLSAQSSEPVTVAYADAGSGSATSGTDYAALTAGTLTFAPGETSKTIDVTVNGDDIDEENETVEVRLSNP
ncbi:MAG: hypothetical protein F4X92_05635, partial [Gammaproteobacteria bacterium]|nr:hypothetical protein [Gammaproteobacteria bacterium]